MNKKVILILLSVVMFSTVSYAQKVIIENGAVIIDCSEMDSKFYDSKPKPQTTSAKHNSAGTNPADDISSRVNNAKIYPKFEVHQTDNSNGTTWVLAINVCAKLNNGAGWRLSTQQS